MKNLLFLILAALACIFVLPATAGASLIAAAPFASIIDLERYANNHLSSFTGEEEEPSFEGADEPYLYSYTGEDDDFMDFGGPGRNFNSAMIAKDISYVMTLVNAAAATRTCYITPGYYPDTGTVIDGSFNDINGNAGLTGSGSPKGVKYFHAFLEEVPTICNGLKIQSTDATQVTQQLTIENLSPFRNLEDKILDLGSFTDEHSFNDKIVSVPTPGLVMGAQTRIKLPVVASSTCTVTFWVGAMLNNSKALQQKAGRALSGVGLFPIIGGGDQGKGRKLFPPLPGKKLFGRR